MLRNDVLTSPLEIEKDLTMLCGDKPLVCLKENDSATGNNHWIIYIRDGKLEYYNLYPDFSKIQKDDTKFQKNMEHFKASIKIQDIHEMEYFPRKKQRKN